MKSTRKTTPITAMQFRAAMTGGLTAAGNVIANEIKRELRGGYRSSLGNKGDFVTGNSLNHVRVSEPVIMGIARGPMKYAGAINKSYVRVGTDLLYNLFWEIGHFNIFTKRYERDLKWGMAFYRARPRALAAFTRVFQRIAFGSGKPAGAKKP
jgi:hypothetical protein